MKKQINLEEFLILKLNLKRLTIIFKKTEDYEEFKIGK